MAGRPRKIGSTSSIEKRKAVHLRSVPTEITQRQREAWNLWCQGHTMTEIAAALGSSRTTVWSDVKVAQKHYEEHRFDDLHAMRVRESQKLDRIERPFLTAAEEGDINAALVVKQLGERRAKLWGLDQVPTQQQDVNVKIEVVHTDDWRMT